MKQRAAALALAALLLLLAVFPASAAADDLFFVAVNDSIPLTITGAKPYYAATGLYVPYTVFDAAPGGVAQAYNASEQTLVLFSRSGRLVFDLDRGTMTDENGASSDVLTIYKSGLLYIPLAACTGHFGLRYAVLTSKSGCAVLRFMTGSEVYDNDLFLEKAENLIAYRIETYEQERSTAAAQPGVRPGTTGADVPQEQTPVYLALTGAAQMREALELLDSYDMTATFFLTAAELEEDPALAREICAAGHGIGLTVDAEEPDVRQGLCAANDALEAALHYRSMLVLLRVAQVEDGAGYRVFTHPEAEQSASQTVQLPESERLLVCEQDLGALLADLEFLDAVPQPLRETSPVR